MVICITQHLSNIWSSNHEKVEQRWSLVEKTVAYKNVWNIFSSYIYIYISMLIK